MSSTVRGLLNPNFHYCIWELHVDVPYPPPPMPARAEPRYRASPVSAAHAHVQPQLAHRRTDRRSCVFHAALRNIVLTTRKDKTAPANREQAASYKARHAGAGSKDVRARARACRVWWRWSVIRRRACSSAPCARAPRRCEHERDCAMLQVSKGGAPIYAHQRRQCMIERTLLRCIHACSSVPCGPSPARAVALADDARCLPGWARQHAPAHPPRTCVKPVPPHSPPLQRRSALRRSRAALRPPSRNQSALCSAAAVPRMVRLGRFAQMHTSQTGQF